MYEGKIRYTKRKQGGGKSSTCQFAGDVATIDFREVQETQQNYPLGVAYFSRFKVQEIIPAVVGGAKANIVFTKPVKMGTDKLA